ncbi:MAG: Fe(2+) transporter permease subunit FeoB [Candidatus Cloacimonetes bacterium]|nr:Fe(2+) transporter permease subunit FeoB [Candidatus Cloacimonadota bacterium]
MGKTGKRKLRIALAGNPNAGKTTVFNALTGARQRVGNWPGVTVERIEGQARWNDTDVEIIDLPGIYSFSAWSQDERIARNFILEQKPDVVIDIVDASNLERNLFLTTQLIELRVPLVVGLNMMDVVQKRRMKLEVEHLAQHLDCPVIPLVATRGEGFDELRDAVLRLAEAKSVPTTSVRYDSIVEEALAEMIPILTELAQSEDVDVRWLAVKLLEKDETACRLAGDICEKLVKHHTHRIERHVGESIDLVLIGGRYGFIHGLSRDVLHRDFDFRKTVSDAIDQILLNRVVGIPIFLAVMYGVFWFTLKASEPFIVLFDRLFDVINNGAAHLLTSIGSPAWLTELTAGGLGGGLQTVATLTPPIFFIFLALSVLEDSGYMSRAAFIADRFMRWIGLPGKAFIPMLIGFGCNVPAILATRTLSNPRDRVLTILINPLMSCGARIPVYILFLGVFYPKTGSLLMFGLYVLGIVLAVLSGLLFKRTLLQGDVSTFVMELPPYHIPTANGVLLHTWRRLKSFVQRAGLIIILIIIIFQALQFIGDADSPGDTFLARAGQFATPVFRPMGIQPDNWEAVVGLLSGVFAKEAIVGTMGSLYLQEAQGSDEPELYHFWGGIRGAMLSFAHSVGGLFGADVEDEQTRNELANVMRQKFPEPAGVIAYLLFVLIYMPCVAVMAVIYKELGMRWMLFSLAWLTGLAWWVATMFYQLATLPAHPGTSLAWAAGLLAVGWAVWWGMKAAARSGRVS